MVEFQDIAEQNIWWRLKEWKEFDKHLSAINFFHFKITRKSLEEKNQVHLIFGPRQVGKTTLLKLKIKELIEKGVKNEKIAYFSCDALLTNKREELREAINALLERDLEYLFIDELSNVPSWDYELKNFIDSGKFSKTKIFITGSPFGMQEYMPGRKIYNFFLMPLTFREFIQNLSLNINEHTKKAFSLKEIEIKEIEKLSNTLNSVSYNFTNINDLASLTKKLSIHGKVLEKLFRFYATIGGFPSVINSFIDYTNTNNSITITEEIKTNKERIIDTISKSGKNEGICFQLINSIKKRLTSRYSFTELKETEIDLSKETIINYLTYLKNVFFLKIIYAYNLGKNEVGYKRHKKIYLIDPFLYNENKMLNYQELIQDQEYLSKIIEATVGIQLSYLKENTVTPLDTFLYFWYNSEEIDFLFKQKDFFAIEVKYSGKLEKFHKLSQVKNYISLTKDVINFQKDEAWIPASIFLALLKTQEEYI